MLLYVVAEQRNLFGMRAVLCSYMRLISRCVIFLTENGPFGGMLVRFVHELLIVLIFIGLQNYKFHLHKTHCRVNTMYIIILN